MSTDFETCIPQSAVDEQQLTQLVGHIATITGQPVQIKKLFVLSTPDTNVALLLDGLRDSIKAERKNGHHPATKPARKAKTAKAAKAAGELGGASWRREDTGEIFSTRALHALVPEGHFPLRTRFVNSKGMFAVVLADANGQAALTKEPTA
jgi:hypothetical protein